MDEHTAIGGSPFSIPHFQRTAPIPSKQRSQTQNPPPSLSILIPWSKNSSKGQVQKREQLSRENFFCLFSPSAKATCFIAYIKLEEPIISLISPDATKYLAFLNSNPLKSKKDKETDYRTSGCHKEICLPHCNSVKHV